MKTVLHHCSTSLVVLIVAFALQGCPMSLNGPTVAGDIRGQWEWVRTNTSTGTFTPKSVGYTKQLVLGNDGRPFVGFYRNDSLQRRENETNRDSVHIFPDEASQTVLIKYGGVGYLHCFLYIDAKQTETLTTSTFLNPYSEKTDTVQHVYVRGKYRRLYPY